MEVKSGQIHRPSRKLKKLTYFKFNEIPLVIWALGTVSEYLRIINKRNEQMNGKIETVQIKPLLKKARIPKRVVETGDNLLYPDSSEKLSLSFCVKKARKE